MFGGELNSLIIALVIFVFHILYFPIPHNTLYLPPQILHKPLFLNAPGNIAFSQEHFKTISYAKFGGANRVYYGELENSQWTHLAFCLS